MTTINSNMNERISIPLLSWANANSSYQTYRELRYESRKKPVLKPRIITGNELMVKSLSTNRQIVHSVMSYNNYKDSYKKEDRYKPTTNQTQLINMKHSSFRPQRILHLANNESLRKDYNEKKKLAQKKRDEPDNINYSLLIRKKDAEINKLLENNLNHIKGRNNQHSAFLRTNYTTTGNQIDINNSTFNKTQPNLNQINRQEAHEYISYLKAIDNQPRFLLKMIKEKKDAKSSRRNKVIIDNKYIDDLLKRVTRRVDYISQNNRIISEDEVMNLLKEESDKINTHVDKLMMATCFIKNFSLAFRQGNELMLLPLINSIIPYEISNNNNSKTIALSISNKKMNIPVKAFESQQEGDYIQSIENVLFKGFKLKSNLIPINEKKGEGLKVSESLASLFNNEDNQFQKVVCNEKEKLSVPLSKYSSNKGSLMRMLVNSQSRSVPKRKRLLVNKERRRSHNNLYCRLQKEIIIKGAFRSNHRSISEKAILTAKNGFLLTQKTKIDLMNYSPNKNRSFESKVKSKEIKDKDRPFMNQKSSFYKDKVKETDERDVLMGDKMKKKLSLYKTITSQGNVKKREIKLKLKESKNNSKAEDEADNVNSDVHDLKRMSQIEEIEINNINKMDNEIKEDQPINKNYITSNTSFKQTFVVNKLNSFTKNETIKRKVKISTDNRIKNNNNDSDSEDYSQDKNKNDTKQQARTQRKTNSQSKNVPKKETMALKVKRNNRKNKQKKTNKKDKGLIHEEDNESELNEDNNTGLFNNMGAVEDNSNKKKARVFFKDETKTKDNNTNNNTNQLVVNKSINNTNQKDKMSSIKLINQTDNNNTKNNQDQTQEEIFNFEHNENDEDYSPEARRLFLNQQPTLNPSNNTTEVVNTVVSISKFKDELFSLGIQSQSEITNITTNQLDQLMKNSNVKSQITAFRSEINKNPFRYSRRGQSLTDADIIKLMLQNIASATVHQRTNTKNMKTILQRLSSIKETAKENMKHDKYQVLFEKLQMPNELLKKDNAKKNYQTMLEELTPFPLNIKTVDDMMESEATHNTFLEYTKKSRLNEFNMYQELQFQIETAEGENGRAKFKDFLSQLENMKNMDGGGYINSLEKHYDNIKEEIEGLVQAKEMEERINQFLNAFSKTRTLINVKRNTLNDKIKIKDHKFDIFMSDRDELYNINEDT